ncbi:MAG: hypothetical protein KAY32_17480 [Candidatus Eisenbacteria sp.]|nr:hypothetical protein [Candidatus Eisenbacteria bacterium]
MPEKPGPETVVPEVRRETPCRYSAEGRIRIVLEGLPGEDEVLPRHQATIAAW